MSALSGEDESPNRKTIFVTGGSGYVGRNLIRRFVADGHIVHALARSESSAAAVAALGAIARSGDMLNLSSLADAMTGCDVLVHAAADTRHGAYEAGQDEANLHGAHNVFAVARSAGIDRAIHISTEAVLLTGAPLINADETMPIPKRHAGSYSRSKAMAEREALSFNSDIMDVIVVRPRFVWGRDDTTALPQLIEAAQTGKLVWIGGGKYLTSTTHIDNLAEGVTLALSKGRGGEVYFITDGAPHVFRDFVSVLLTEAGQVPPTKSVPRWLIKIVVALGDKAENWTRGRVKAPLPTQQYATVGVEVTLSGDKAMRELGYRPIVGLEAGLGTLASVNARSAV
ncbi:MAG: NAD-dependent epimerase/dehydratase family protein [Sphingomonadaceae bacterium]|nr:NAD-dependent epimerase/dehydratase family protein [Sphingomonadaceae bacterium]